jgi:aryl-alcohol dehydrogenase-like predicted oxidoreductase
MRYMTLGRNTGLRVSEFGLGGFGAANAGSTGRDEVVKVFEQFAEAGGTLIDTANTYQFGASEAIVGDLVASDREHFVLGTKYSGAGAKRGVLDTGNSRKNMVQSVEDSLGRLKTSYIDLFWAHWPDKITPMDEILRGFDDLVRSGKVLYVGLSNFPAWRVARADAIASQRGWSPVIAIQIEYSLVERSAERELLPMAEALGIGVVLWSPLGGGLLTGKYRRGETGRFSSDEGADPEDSAQKREVMDVVLTVADEMGVSASKVAMAWLRQRGRRAATPFVPIIGPRNRAQLGDYLDSLELELSERDFERLDAVSAVPLGVPHALGAELLERLWGGDADRMVVPNRPVP